jgi:hypothetical protein
MDEKITACECSEPGWCERHQCRKSASALHKCQTSPKHFAMWEAGNGLEQAGRSNKKSGVNAAKRTKNLLGTKIEKALTSVGITEARVTKFLGRPCGCKARRDKLNALHQWFLDSFKKKSKEEAAEDAASIVP